jgi:hypothetical protein
VDLAAVQLEIGPELFREGMYGQGADLLIEDPGGPRGPGQNAGAPDVAAGTGAYLLPVLGGVELGPC